MSGARMQPLPRTAQLLRVSTSILLQICLPLLPPPCLFQRLKEMKLKARNHFSILKVPYISINISKGPPAASPAAVTDQEHRH